MTSSMDTKASESSSIRYSEAHSNHLPPGSITDFRWKDYSPSIFRLVQRLMNIRQDDYILSVCGDETLRKVTSGRPGSLFLMSKDDRFTIKILRKSEIKVILEMLPNYYRHIQQHRSTVMLKMYGAHSVKPLGGVKVYFVVFSNIFQPNIMMHRVYDLKGSRKGRNPKKVKVREKTILKDSDFEFRFYIDPMTRQRLLSQVKLDCDFLAAEGVMDYSLILGVHVIGPHKSLFEDTNRYWRVQAQGGSGESISSNKLGVKRFDSPDHSCPSSPSPSTSSRASIDSGSSYYSLVFATSIESRSSFSCQDSGTTRIRNISTKPHNSHMTRDSNLLPRFLSRLAIDNSMGMTFDDIWLRNDSSHRRSLGINMPARAVKVARTETKSESNREIMRSQQCYDVVLYFEIVDTFQNYGVKKRLEHAYKSIQHDSKSITSVNPRVYSSRFLEFLSQTFQAEEEG